PFDRGGAAFCARGATRTRGAGDVARSRGRFAARVARAFAGGTWLGAAFLRGRADTRYITAAADSSSGVPPLDVSATCAGGQVAAHRNHRLAAPPCRLAA